MFADLFAGSLGEVRRLLLDLVCKSGG